MSIYDSDFDQPKASSVVSKSASKDLSMKVRSQKPMVMVAKKAALKEAPRVPKQTETAVKEATTKEVSKSP